MADSEGPTCSSCGTEPAGRGGILCPGCVARIEASVPWPVAQAAQPGPLTGEKEPEAPISPPSRPRARGRDYRQTPTSRAVEGDGFSRCSGRFRRAGRSPVLRHRATMTSTSRARRGRRTADPAAAGRRPARPIRPRSTAAGRPSNSAAGAARRRRWRPRRHWQSDAG